MDELDRPMPHPGSSPVSPNLGSPRSGSRCASPRPGTPPPLHVSPNRRNMTGLPASPSRSLSLSPAKRLYLSPSKSYSLSHAQKLASRLSKLPSEEYLQVVIMENVEEEDSNYLIPNPVSSPGVVMPPSQSLENLPAITPGMIGTLTPVNALIPNLDSSTSDNTPQNLLTVAKGTYVISQTGSYAPTCNQSMTSSIMKLRQQIRSPTRIHFSDSQAIADDLPSPNRTTASGLLADPAAKQAIKKKKVSYASEPDIVKSTIPTPLTFDGTSVIESSLSQLAMKDNDTFEHTIPQTTISGDLNQETIPEATTSEFTPTMASNENKTAPLVSPELTTLDSPTMEINLNEHNVSEFNFLESEIPEENVTDLKLIKSNCSEPKKYENPEPNVSEPKVETKASVAPPKVPILMEIPSEPSYEGVIAQPTESLQMQLSKKKNKDKKKTLKKSFWTWFSCKYKKHPGCRYIHHNEDYDYTMVIRAFNREFLADIEITADCECLLMCPKLTDLLESYKDFLLKAYKVGPYDATRTRNTAIVEMQMASEWLMNHHAITRQDKCLRVTFKRDCGLHQDFLAHFAMFNGFRGFTVRGEESFIVYKNAEAANLAIATLHGQKFLLDHTMQVEKTSLAHIKNVVYSSPDAYMCRPCILKIMYGRDPMPGPVPEGDEGKEQQGVEQATEDRRGDDWQADVQQASGRHGGDRRVGDERRLPRTRMLARPPVDPSLCWGCSPLGLLETPL